MTVVGDIWNYDDILTSFVGSRSWLQFIIEDGRRQRSPSQCADGEELPKLGTAVEVPAIINVTTEGDIKCITARADFAETSRDDMMRDHITAG